MTLIPYNISVIRFIYKICTKTSKSTTDTLLGEIHCTWGTKMYCWEKLWTYTETNTLHGWHCHSMSCLLLLKSRLLFLLGFVTALVMCIYYFFSMHSFWCNGKRLIRIHRTGKYESFDLLWSDKIHLQITALYDAFDQKTFTNPKMSVIKSSSRGPST